MGDEGNLRGPVVRDQRFQFLFVGFRVGSPGEFTMGQRPVVRGEEGKLGDFTVIDSDPTRVPVETIKDIEVAMTIIGGAVVYSK